MLTCKFPKHTTEICCLEQVISDYNPDIILGTETWLSPDIRDAEILPSGYTILRRDRESSDHHGGVLQAIRSDLVVTRKARCKTDCEILYLVPTPNNGQEINSVWYILWPQWRRSDKHRRTGCFTFKNGPASQQPQLATILF